MKELRGREVKHLHGTNISELVGDGTQVADHFNAIFTTVVEETLNVNNSYNANKADVIQHNPKRLLITFAVTFKKKSKRSAIK